MKSGHEHEHLHGILGGGGEYPESEKYNYTTTISWQGCVEFGGVQI